MLNTANKKTPLIKVAGALGVALFLFVICDAFFCFGVGVGFGARAGDAPLDRESDPVNYLLAGFAVIGSFWLFSQWRDFAHVYKPLVILSLLGAVFTLLSIFGKIDAWYLNPLGNIGAGFFEVMLTFLILNRVLESKEISNQKAKENAALRSLRQPLIKFSQTIFNALKSTSIEPSESGKKSMNFLFNADSAARIKWLNVKLDAPVIIMHGYGVDGMPITEKMLWARYLHASFNEFNAALDSFVDKYAVLLSLPNLELCEKIRWHQVTGRVRVADEIASKVSNSKIPLAVYLKAENDEDLLSDYFDLVADLACVLTAAGDYGNTPSGLTYEAIWTNNVEPIVGSGLVF